ncbi:putative aspartic proteinase GIP1 [Sesamum angolense]|uniref:Aspartic proteinase GIP1 n=1 Tax=Sesamum angolense TaxID=2727404 RepID=A0AAE1XA28_9LAMI|nr:putative aspartic proteinase GIP1 [Sesamum angolense]
MTTTPLITLTFFSFFFFFFSVRLHCSSAQTLVTPVSKDKSTSLYTLSIYVKTPLQLSKLHLDLGSYIPWHDCDRGRYNDSSSYRPVHAKTALCKEMIPRAIGYCYEPAHPGCANNSCGFFPENPVTRESSAGDLIQDKFALLLPGAGKRGQPGPISKLLLSCVSSTIFSKLLRGLAGGSVGLASLGRYNHSLPAQLSTSFSSPQIFSICLPSSSKDPGIDELGRGGVKISSSKPYSELETSVFRALTDAFVKEAGGLNLSLIQPAVEPFKVCYAVDEKQGSGAGDPPFPTIDLVLQGEEVIWRISGSNSMVRVMTKNNVDAWCLGFVDGGDAPRTSIIIGGRQLEDNLLQFDLDSGRLGFSWSLLLRNTSCSNFYVKSTTN